jgi:hypothetical protein
LPSREITNGVSAVGDANSSFNGKSEWKEVRNRNFCVIITIYSVLLIYRFSREWRKTIDERGEMRNLENHFF